MEALIPAAYCSIIYLWNGSEETLQEVIQMDSAINKTNERLNFVSQNKEVLREYHMREMALSDWTTGINTAIEQGIMQGKLEIAKNLKSMGLSVDQIAEGTGLDKETIQSLNRG